MRGHRAPAVMMKECDLIIALGTSFTHAFAGENYDQFNPSAKLIMVNIDSSEMTKPGLNVDIAIEMDLKQFISELIDDPKVCKMNSKYSEWLKKCEKYRKPPKIRKILKNRRTSKNFDFSYFLKKAYLCIQLGPCGLKKYTNNYFCDFPTLKNRY